MAFDGFPPGALDVLAGLEQNNDPRWFAAHRHEYDRLLLEPQPYKTHLGIWLWQGEGPSRCCPGFLLRLSAQSLLLQAGRAHFERDVLERYRKAVADPARGTALQAPSGRIRGRRAPRRAAPPRRPLRLAPSSETVKVRACRSTPPAPSPSCASCAS